MPAEDGPDAPDSRASGERRLPGARGQSVQWSRSVPAKRFGSRTRPGGRRGAAVATGAARVPAAVPTSENGRVVGGGGAVARRVRADAGSAAQVPLAACRDYQTS